MEGVDEFSISYFMSVTHSSRDKAKEYLDKTNGMLDTSLNLFFEHKNTNNNQNIFGLQSKCINAQSEACKTKSIGHAYERSYDVSKFTPRKPILIPSMIDFPRFLELSDTNKPILLENSTKMMNLAMKYSQKNQADIPSDEIDHWKIHVSNDYERLQALLDNDMCAPLVWIEHFEHLLNGDICQLFDCDYMFNIAEYKTKE